MTMSPWAVAAYTLLLGAAISFVIAGLIKFTFVAIRAADARQKRAEAAARAAGEESGSVRLT